MSATYDITRSGFERNFYGGFVRGSYAYYFASDNSPPTDQVRSFKVMRVCHNSNFGALHELSLMCGGVAPSGDVRISGVSVVDEDFGGIAGPVVILSRNRPGNSQQNYVCLYSLPDIERVMQEKYDSCSKPLSTSSEEIDLAWRGSREFCHLSRVSKSIS